jgi:hypothetical protein
MVRSGTEVIRSKVTFYPFAFAVKLFESKITALVSFKPS